jgi:hypothetical protein
MAVASEQPPQLLAKLGLVVDDEDVQRLQIRHAAPPYDRLMAIR